MNIPPSHSSSHTYMHPQYHFLCAFGYLKISKSLKRLFHAFRKRSQMNSFPSPLIFSRSMCSDVAHGHCVSCHASQPVIKTLPSILPITCTPYFFDSRECSTSANVYKNTTSFALAVVAVVDGAVMVDLPNTEPEVLWFNYPWGMCFGASRMVRSRWLV